MSTNFGIDDLIETSEGSWLAAASWAIFRIFVLGLSGLTTFLFFARFVPDAFGFLAGDLSPYVSGLAGVMVLDVGAQVWGYLRGHHARTIDQLAIARAMGAADLILSTLVTVLFFALTSGFNVGIYDQAGELSRLGQALHYAGVTVIILAVGANFVTAWLYSQAGENMRQALQRSQLAATVAAGRFEADRTRAQLVTRQTLAEILAALPELAERQGQAAGRDYLAHTMGAPAQLEAQRATVADDHGQAVTAQPTGAPARPTPNGRGV